jgi:hypothetical protein
MEINRSLRDICRKISEYVSEIYILKCLKHVDIDIPRLDSLCRGEYDENDSIKRSLDEILKILRDTYDLCSQARKEFGETFLNIEQWRNYEHIYLNINKVNEKIYVISESFKKSSRIFRRLYYLLTIFSITILILLFIPYIGIDVFYLFSLVIYIFVLLIPIIFVDKRITLSLFLLGILMLPGVQIFYMIHSDSILLASYTSIIITSLYLSYISMVSRKSS